MFFSPFRQRLRFLLLLIAVLAASAGADRDAAAESGDGDRPRYVVIAIYDTVYNTELMAPMDVWDHAGRHLGGGLKVVTAAATLDPVTTYEGLRVLPDYTFETAPEAEILVIPSAESTERDAENKALLRWIRRASEGARLTMSHCWGAFLLAKAGLLDGLHATTYPPDSRKLEKMFPEIHVRHDARFVDAGRIITSAGGVFSYDASLYAVRRLFGDEIARKVARGLVIEDWMQEHIAYEIAPPGAAGGEGARNGGR